MLETFLNALLHQQEKCTELRRTLECIVSTFLLFISFLKRLGNMYNFVTSFRAPKETHGLLMETSYNGFLLFLFFSSFHFWVFFFS